MHSFKLKIFGFLVHLSFLYTYIYFLILKVFVPNNIKIYKISTPPPPNTDIISNNLLHVRASLVAQSVKNLPAMLETWV